MVVKKKNLLLGAVALIGLLPGCGVRKSGNRANKMVASRTVDIPLADNEVVAGSDIALEEETLRSFFDNDIEEFVAALEQEDGENQHVAQAEESAAEEMMTEVDSNNDAFAWVEDADDHVAQVFKTVYFDFDRHGVRPDQKNIVEKDIDVARATLAQARQEGQEPTIVIEGHSCHSAGSSAYNLALSEKRAKAIADWFVNEGVARENIKIVGRGKEVPAVIDGQAVSGGRDEQAPNRRVEVRVINS